MQLLMAAVFVFRPASHLSKTGFIYYHSYFADLVMPFCFYFLLVANETKIPLLRIWFVKAAIIFIAMTTSEIFQYFGIYFFGVTFDPMDILAFAIGTSMAVLFDLMVFPKIFRFWRREYE